jgi:hypothetical protein
MEENDSYPQNSNQNLDPSSIPQQKSNKKIWLLILIPILVIVIVLVVFLFIRLNELDDKKEEILEKAREILPDEELLIFEEAINEASNMEELIELEDSIDAFLNALGTPIDVEFCIEDWYCTGWSPCISGEQTRNCTDSNSCGTTEDKLNEQQNCTLQTINCGSNTLSQGTQGDMPNFDCFIEASENCDPSKLLNTVTIEIFGILSTSITYMELKGMESGKCIYYQRTENNSIGFKDEVVQMMLDGGETQEEINQQEQTANEAVQVTVGLEQTCKFDSDNLTAILNRWKEGSFSDGASCNLVNGEFVCEYTGDFENAECESSS